MENTIFWDDKKHRRLRYVFAGVWDWDEFYAQIDAGCALIATVAHPVDMLLDFRMAGALDPDAVLKLKRAASLAEDLDGRCVVIADDAAMQTTYHLFLHVYPRLQAKFFLCTTVEEAHALLDNTPRQ
ncbi:MAG: hypothetical protein SNJ59_02745 [Aggregatilineales bacterium]